MELPVQDSAGVNIDTERSYCTVICGAPTEIAAPFVRRQSTELRESSPKYYCILLRALCRSTNQNVANKYLIGNSQIVRYFWLV